jgi:hypothetical protein
MKKVFILAFLATLVSASNDDLLVDLTNFDVNSVNEEGIATLVDDVPTTCTGKNIGSGWNLISLVGDTSVSKLSVSGVQKIWFFKNNQWLQSGDILVGDGFWMNNTKTVCISDSMYTSKAYTKPTITTSWQLLGVGSEALSVSSDLKDASLIWTFTNNKWEHPTQIQSGQGFWAKK